MHQHVDDQLEAHLAGELSPDQEGVFQEHLRQCRSCEQTLAEARSARSCLAWLLPEEAPPVPGPGFYARVQQNIERKAESSWFGVLAQSWQPRLAYPLLLFGLLVAAWTMTFQMDVEEESVFGFPSTQFSSLVPSEAERLDNRDLVMTSLIEIAEGN